VNPGKPATKCSKKGGVCSLRQFIFQVSILADKSLMNEP